MPRLIIRRKREIINWARIVSIYLDNEKIGIISNGQTEEFEITEGEHKLKAKLDWCGSNEVSFIVKGDEEHTVTLCAYKLADFFAFFPIFIFLIHNYLRNNYGIGYVIWLVIPFFLYGFYYLTLGRNKYLRFEEDQLSLSFK